MAGLYENASTAVPLPSDPPAHPVSVYPAGAADPAARVRVHHTLVLSADSTLACLCQQPGAPPYALILLNAASLDAALLQRLWPRCAVVLCADGAANRLRALDADRLHTIQNSSESRSDSRSTEQREAATRWIPNAIVGDLDSLLDATREHYSELGVPVVHVADQDSTDLDKCLAYILQLSADQVSSHGGNLGLSPFRVLICGGFGGRFDHELGALHSMCQWNDKFTSIQLVDIHNVCTVLCPGSHIFLPTEGADGPHCGLVPIQGPVRSATTRGLQWDMSDQGLQMGAFVSVCNQLQDGAVLKAEHMGTGVLSRVGVAVGAPSGVLVRRQICRGEHVHEHTAECLLKGCAMEAFGGDDIYSDVSTDDIGGGGRSISNERVGPIGVYVYTSDSLLWTSSLRL